MLKFLIIQGTPNKSHPQYNYTDAKAIKTALQSFNHLCDIWGPGYDNFKTHIDFSSYDVIFLIENYWKSIDKSDWLPDLSNTKNFKIIWAIDEHMLGEEYFENEFKRSKYSLYLTASKINASNSKYWFPCSFNSDLIYPMKDIEKSIPLGFCGNLHNREPIIRFIKKMNYNIQVDSKFGYEMVKAVNSYQIHLNKNISYDINIRNFETLACKSLLLTHYHSAYDDLGFKHGVNCLFYTNQATLIKNLNDILTDPQKILDISKNGYELSKKHTFYNRIKHLLNLLEKKI